MEEKKLFPIQMSPYKDIIAEYFDRTLDFEFLDQAAYVFNRIDFHDLDLTKVSDLYELITTEFDEVLPTKIDEWKLLRYYCSPYEANWDIAYDSFVEDLVAIAMKILASLKTE